MDEIQTIETPQFTAFNKKENGKSSTAATKTEPKKKAVSLRRVRARESLFVLIFIISKYFFFSKKNYHDKKQKK